MSDVIDLGPFRLLRDVKLLQGHALAYVDEKGVKWFKFACHYEAGEKLWRFELWATSWEDARFRLETLKATAAIDGPICEEISLDSPI